ncbi:hypothetical protein C1X21_11400 [Pseudomonas sp. FW305-3-2-15-A-LB2]|nr:hypothetical protein C1X17_13715 [Pseudomonas sp. FW305-3-2-15-C-TSA2]PMV29320.1 hypothetical protein C1X22_11285 [Pseudomonas sp. DP16D-L5]PMV39223.1 hypothetical protein C1X21_11400 [Pseudomonas sp. FW305-3-2-15-A-LB2]PMV45533.1 hypothetical protein C1X16_12930 [Pseudomonas sp. FW305-3-2-15-C-R2A1]PMV52024.1 hypothetical protein C1X18_12020 [Pseudomonas sp. FW305-3-2-15-C-LB1]PMV57171.1 hypothetical protein C1X19_11460 [Pseudomonas sp. GW460-4]PMV63325.1 hypothetical protein C1X20_11135 
MWMLGGIRRGFDERLHRKIFKSGLWSILFDKAIIDHLFTTTEIVDGYPLYIDMEEKYITGAEKSGLHFEVDSVLRHCLFNGLDIDSIERYSPLSASASRNTALGI